MRGRGGDDRWGASSEAGAASVTMAGGKAKALGALVEATVLLLVTLTSTNEAGIAILGMGWGKNWVCLIEESFPSVSSFLGFLGT